MAKKEEKDEGFPSGIFFLRLAGIISIALVMILIAWFMWGVISMCWNAGGP